MVRLLLPSAATCVVEVIDTETQRCRDTERCREKGRPFHSDWALQICLSRMVKCHLHTEVGNLSALALKWIDPHVEDLWDLQSTSLSLPCAV